MIAPPVDSSTREEREEYVRWRFCCKADCDNCGNCAFLRGRLPEELYADYIEGLCSFAEISVRART